MMVLKINNTDISADIAFGGIKYKREAVVSKTVTTLNGLEHIAKQRERVTVELTFQPLTYARLHQILGLFSAAEPYVTLTFTDPYNGQRNITCENLTKETQLSIIYQNGTEYYSGLKIALKER